jgi:hypothetical protein
MPWKMFRCVLWQEEDEQKRRTVELIFLLSRSALALLTQLVCQEKRSEISAAYIKSHNLERTTATRTTYGDIGEGKYWRRKQKDELVASAPVKLQRSEMLNKYDAFGANAEFEI